MILECKIADFSPIVDRTVSEIQNEFKVKIIHMHHGLPPFDPDNPLKFRQNPKEENTLPKGWYIKFGGTYGNAIKLAKTASSASYFR